jgi:methanogenic corrinoid protein MtbC1
MTDSANSAPVIDENCYRRYFEALLAGDRLGCANLLQEQLRQGVSLKTIYLDLMQRAMYEVGSLWERNLVSVATEHLAAAITEALLTLVYPRIFSQPHRDRRAVIACVPQERHQIGARMVADFFELHGWHGFFLGANTPIEDLISLIRERDIDVVGLSMSLLFNLPQLEAMLAAVSTEFPSVALFLGGRAFHGETAGREAREDLMQRYPRLRYFDSVDELESYLNLA